MRPVSVLIFHAPAQGSGPREAQLVAARGALAQVHRRQFLAAGADAVRIVVEPPGDSPFADRLRRALVNDRNGSPEAHRPGRKRARPEPGTRGGGGLVVLGSGALPLARLADLRRLVEVAAGPPGRALANNLYSADAFAIADADVLAAMPPFRGDNEVPRWLAEEAGVGVADLRDRWRLQADLDSPLDIILAARDRSCPRPIRGLGGTALADAARGPLRTALAEVARVMGDRSAELVVVGRTSATTLRWLETQTRCRVRAIVEERGLRAAGEANRRPPRSLLGRVLDLEGPDSLALQLAELGDAAIVDSRVLLAHRLGADERLWPAAEDRFASDLLDAQAIADPWLRALTSSAANGGLPILLGGHSLVGPSVRLLGPVLHE